MLQDTATQVMSSEANSTTRRPARLRSGSNSSSSQISDGAPTTRGGRNDGDRGKKTFSSNICLPNTSTANMDEEESTSPEDEDDAADDNDEDEGSDEEPDDIAPFGVAKKRGHQTGLSVSLSNATLGKRGRSPASDISEDRPTSRRKIDAENDLSDDDEDYNAVDEISESEEDGDVEELEEQMIIDSEEEEASGRPKRGSVSSADSFLGLGAGTEDLLGVTPFFNEQMANTDTLAQESVLREDEGVVPARRVRFAEEVQRYSSSSSSESDDEEGEEGVYPDLFLQKDSLDPTFRKLIEQRDDESVTDGEGSYWDFENEQRIVEELDESGSDSGSSGYESDEGETTDEEVLPPRTVNRPQTFLRLNAGRVSRPRAAPTPAPTPVRKGTVSAARRGPTMGSFLVDQDKPIAVVDGHGKHMLFFPAPRHRQKQAVEAVTAASSPATSHALINGNIQSETESDAGFSQANPMLSSPANVMISGFFHGTTTRTAANSSLGAEIMGPPEAFFPFTSVNSNGIIETDDGDFFEDFSEDEDLRIEDFIDFGDEASSEDENRGQEQNEEPDSNSTANEEGNELSSTPQGKRSSSFPALKSRQPSTPTPVAPGSLLAHFDKGVASSFRRNADRHKSWTRSPVTGGIKGGRLHAMNSPISPMRRRRGMSASSGIANSTNYSSPHQANAVVKTSTQHPLGGPLKKRIENSNHLRRRRKSTI